MNKKDLYIEKARAKIDERVARLDQLKAQLRGEAADGKLEVQRRIDDLEGKVKAARSRLEEIVESADDRWEDLTERFDTLADEVSASVKKLFKRES